MALDPNAYGGMWEFSNGVGDFRTSFDMAKNGYSSLWDDPDTLALANQNQDFLRSLGFDDSFATQEDNSEGGGQQMPTSDFSDWAQSRGLNIGLAQPNKQNGGAFWRGLFDNSGKLVGTPMGTKNNPGDFVSMVSLMAAPFAGPALSTWAGGGAVGGATAGAVMGGAQGAGNAIVSGGGLDDVFKQGATGALKGGAAGGLGSAFGTGANQFNLGGSLDLNPALGSFTNQAGNILGKSLVTGKDPTNSLLMSGANAAFNNLGSLFDTGPTSSFGDNMNDFSSYNYDFGSSPTDMFGNMSLTQSNPGMQDFAFPDSVTGAQPSDSDWQATLKKYGNNPIIKALIGGGQQPATPGQPQQGGLSQSPLGGLLGMYLGNRQSKEIGRQIGGLNSLFGQDSPYAQQLRQQLARKDAAAGRRSQAGTREVELQARLAELNSRNAPQLQSLYNQQMGNRNLMANGIVNNAGLIDLFKKGAGYLGGLMPQSSEPMYQAPDLGNDYDTYDFMGNGG